MKMRFLEGDKTGLYIDGKTGLPTAWINVDKPMFGLKITAPGSVPLENLRDVVRTMSAAYELLEALTELEAVAHNLGGEHPRFDTLNAKTAKARAAIAKATGETP